MQQGSEEDKGGVHSNSGIPNRAFYLASKQVGGKIWEKTGKVWHGAMKQGRYHDFSTFAKRTVDISYDMHGERVSNLIGQAWTKVGVSPMVTKNLNSTQDTQENSNYQMAFYHNKKHRKTCCLSRNSLVAISASCVAIGLGTMYHYQNSYK